MRIVLLGSPGSGKGSQAELLQEKFNLKHIPSGEILRKEIRAKTIIGKKIELLLKKGNLAPDDLVDSIISKRIKRRDNFVLDGYPRRLAQAKFLDSIAKIDKVFLLEVSRESIIKRLSNRRVCGCGETYNLLTKKPKKDLICDKCNKKLYHRDDDKPDAVRKRLNIYEIETMLVINYYENKGLLVRLDGEKDMATISSKISAALYRKGLYK